MALIFLLLSIIPVASIAKELQNKELDYQSYPGRSDPAAYSGK